MSSILRLIWSATIVLLPALAAARTPAEFLSMLPDSVAGVSSCRVSLNGNWEFSASPLPGYWTDTSATGWTGVQVPGEPMMQGLPVVHDVPFAYRTLIPIAGEWAGKRIIVRFNGVYSHARVWVNGHFVRDHHGGFTSWDCEITPFVMPGRGARLMVGVEDRLDDISFGSGYAKHPIGGILRSVELVAVPALHVRSLNTAVEFDALYRDAELSLQAELSAPDSATLRLSLLDPTGRRVPLRNDWMTFTRGHARMVYPVKSPQHWDAEHPRLYTLTADLVVKGRVAERVSRRIGFREVRVEGTRLLVNGKPVKLRGACRHDMHPLLGRSTTPEQDRRDAELAKEANINFIRTSHYPPSPDFLAFCDELGIYVEEETAVCFVGTHRQEPYAAKGASENDTAFTGRYLSQLREMMERDRNHPSVIIWSIGNENEYGTNFQRSYEAAKRMDLTRPVMFSYPGKVSDGYTCYDIVSIHYVNTEGRSNQYGIVTEDFGTAGRPVLHDEWAHVPCYNLPTLESDPNVRNFWGESLKKMWDSCFVSEGGAGGAIWGFVDEEFMLPDTVVGYGPWGIVDVWRRKKPEFWNTRKAYSPVRVEQTRFERPGRGKPLLVPLFNRFDHTNFRELQVRIGDGTMGTVRNGPDIPPHTHGTMSIPSRFLEKQSLRVRFVLGGSVIDEEVLALNDTIRRGPAPPCSLEVVEGARLVTARGDGFAIIFDRATGLITGGTIAGRPAILDGPGLHLSASGGKISWSADSLVELGGVGWSASQVGFEKSPGELTVISTGRSGDLEVTFKVVVDGRGELRTMFELPAIPPKWREIGVSFVLAPSLDSLSWRRIGLWSTYPEDHIGRPSGSTLKLASRDLREDYRVRPEHPWAQDTKDFFLYGKTVGRPMGQPAVPAVFRGTKEGILRYALADRRHGDVVEVISEGMHAARAVAHDDGTTTLLVLSEWNYRDISWGNVDRVRGLPVPFRGECRIRLIAGKGAE